jgi:hypothetical protein
MASKVGKWKDFDAYIADLKKTDKLSKKMRDEAVKEIEKMRNNGEYDDSFWNNDPKGVICWFVFDRDASFWYDVDEAGF